MSVQLLPSGREQDERGMPRVIVSGFDIGFFRLTWLLTKVALASVPGLFVFLIVAFFISAAAMGFIQVFADKVGLI